MLPILSENIWIHNLYLRALFENVPVGTKREDSFITLAAVAPYNKAPGTATGYFTNMTFQGDNAGPTVGVFGDERTYIAGELSQHLSSLFGCCLRWWQLI